MGKEPTPAPDGTLQNPCFSVHEFNKRLGTFLSSTFLSLSFFHPGFFSFVLVSCYVEGCLCSLIFNGEKVTFILIRSIQLLSISILAQLLKRKLKTTRFMVLISKDQSTNELWQEIHSVMTGSLASSLSHLSIHSKPS